MFHDKMNDFVTCKLSVRLLLSYNIPLLTSSLEQHNASLLMQYHFACRAARENTTALKFKILCKQRQTISMVCIFIWYQESHPESSVLKTIAFLVKSEHSTILRKVTLFLGYRLSAKFCKLNTVYIFIFILPITLSMTGQSFNNKA